MQKYDIKTFQGMILALQDYWAQNGCTIVQPLDMEVGAGTSHPMTCLRALGPEPMSTAYVQPSRRPTDGRYGENPNRLQHYSSIWASTSMGSVKRDTLARHVLLTTAARVRSAFTPFLFAVSQLKRTGRIRVGPFCPLIIKFPQIFTFALFSRDLISFTSDVFGFFHFFPLSSED